MEKRKYNIIKKILIPTLVLAIFLLPISPILNKHDSSIAFEQNIINASSGYLNDFTATVQVSKITSGSAFITATVQSNRANAFNDYYNDYSSLSALPADNSGFVLVVSETKNPIEENRTAPLTWDNLGFVRDYSNNNIIVGHPLKLIEDSTGTEKILRKTYGSLDSEKTYYAAILLKDKDGNLLPISNNVVSFNTLKNGEGTTPEKASSAYGDTWDFGCFNLTQFSLSGCVAEFSYSVLFKLSAVIAELGGKFLDFFIFYSTSSTSYTSVFVEKGWSAVRDIANILFILALLYVAIETILGISSHGKKIIGYVIIFSLLINFSLFTTKVVIDSSNILAKIFYGNIVSKNANGSAVAPGGEKSISVSLVSLFNPQKLVSKETYDTSHGQFIFITLAASGIMLYMAYIFFAVALLYLSRVISLWLSMIFSPLAFASYAFPFNLGKMSHSEWWSELFKNAFLAPMFLFMLYLITMFATFLNSVVQYPDSADLLQKTMSVIIPFAFVVGLLRQSQKLAVEYSGEMGKQVVALGKKIGGFAAGAALAVASGGASMLVGGASAGMLAGGVGKSLTTAAGKKGLGGFMARQGLKTLNYGTKASFDARSGLIGKGLNLTGLKLDSASLKTIGLGTDKSKGGFTAKKDRWVEKKLKESELYKTKMSDDEVKAWSKKRIDDYNTQSPEYKRTHEPPKEYNSAVELNNDRLREFKNNLGQSDLLGSLAYTIQKKRGRLVDENNYKNSEEYLKDDTLTAEQINKKRVQGMKMKIGVGAVIATGGAAGGFAAAGAGAFGYGQSMIEKAGEKDLGKKIDKTIRRGEKDQAEKEMGAERRGEIEDFMNKYTENLKPFIENLQKEAGTAGKSFDEYIEERSAAMNEELENIKEKRDLNKQEREILEKQKQNNEERRTAILGNFRLKDEERELQLRNLDLEVEAFQAKETRLKEANTNLTNSYNSTLKSSQELSTAVKGKDKLIQFEKELRAINTREATLNENIEKNYAAPAAKASSDHGDKGHGGGGHGDKGHRGGGASLFTVKNDDHGGGHGGTHGGGH